MQRKISEARRANVEIDLALVRVVAIEKDRIRGENAQILQEAVLRGALQVAKKGARDTDLKAEIEGDLDQIVRRDLAKEDRDLDQTKGETEEEVDLGRPHPVGTDLDRVEGQGLLQTREGDPQYTTIEDPDDMNLDRDRGNKIPVRRMKDQSLIWKKIRNLRRRRLQQSRVLKLYLKK